jgi:hypothetical protein
MEGASVNILAFILGILCLFVVLLDAFQTIILPRRATGRIRLTSVFYALTWTPWRFVARRLHNPRHREAFFSYFGPLSLILLLALWATLMIFGFALLFYSLGSPFTDSTHMARFYSDLYVSGTTIFTLGLGDVIPQTSWSRSLLILEAGTGFGLLAVVMGYFPVLYAAFSRREVIISLLDARAGSPPTAAELLRRNSYEGAEEVLALLLTEWERWSAELLESHLSYPLLCYFRSQHNNQSWLSALTAILDTSALLVSGVRGAKARQAQLTFAMARHAVVDLSQVFSCRPVTNMPDRLPPERYQRLFDQLCKSSISVCHDSLSSDRLLEMRALYEGYAEALSRHLALPLPPWILDEPRKDNWMTVARVRKKTEDANPDQGNDPAATRSLTGTDDHYSQF